MALVFDNKGKLTCCGKPMAICSGGAICSVCGHDYPPSVLEEVAKQEVFRRQVEREEAKEGER